MMASSTHIELSDFIKSVHTDLRERSKIVGVDLAWKNHCSDKLLLDKYSKTMKELATTHWDNNLKHKSNTPSRIDWVVDKCDTYFLQNDLLEQRNREFGIASKLNVEHGYYHHDYCRNFDKLKILDVGSCYNPFAEVEWFDVLAVDIAPANENVLLCDFVNVIVDDKISFRNGMEIGKLPGAFYDVVVFSLFLEYLPCAKQRSKCCATAYEILKPEGLLFIITPDSKHVGANAKYIKSWRYVLAEMGYSRIYYEKLTHIHCMAFRKNVHTEISKRWALIYQKYQAYNDIFIPQDFNIVKNEEQMSVKEIVFDDVSYFNELPFSDLI